MVEERDIIHKEFLVGALHLVLADFPYNVLRVHKIEHPTHVSFVADGMKTFLSQCEKFTKMVAHRPVFCIALPFSQCYYYPFTKIQ